MTARAVIVSVASIIAGAVLIALFAAADASVFHDIPARLRRLNHVPVLAFVVLTVINIFLTSWKWRRLSLASSDDPGQASRVPYTAYTVLNAAVSQFVPNPVATVVVRSIAMRHHLKIPLRRGAGLAVFDKMFDVLALIPLLAATFAVFSGWTSSTSVGLAVIGAVVLCSGAIWGLSTATGLGPLAVGPPRRLFRMFEAHSAIREKRFLTLHYGISLARAANLLLRALIVAIAVDTALPLGIVAQAFPVVQLTMLAPLTPANLGIAEWTWVGVMTMAGVGFHTVVDYALTSRVLQLATLVVLGVTALIYLATRNKQFLDSTAHLK